MKQNLWSVVSKDGQLLFTLLDISTTVFDSRWFFVKEVDCEHPPEALAMAKEKSDAVIDQRIRELEGLLREKNNA